MLAMGNYKKTLNELKSIDIVQPEKAGRIWKGLHHFNIAKTFLNFLKDNNFEIIEANWAVSGKNNSRLVGGIQIKTRNLLEYNEINYSIGILNTNDLSRALTIVIGATVLVCTNGVASGEIVLKHKHTNKFNFENMLNKNNNSLNDLIHSKLKNVYNVIEGMKTRKIDSIITDNLLITAAKKRIIPWNHLREIYYEFENSSFDFSNNTLWDLYNAATHIAKRRPPFQQLNELYRLRKLWTEDYEWYKWEE